MASPRSQFRQWLDEIAATRIREGLLETKGNAQMAAKKLGTSRTTMWRILQRVDAAQDEENKG